MHEQEEQRIVEGYEIVQAIRIGDKEVVFGVNEKAEMPYFCSFYTSNTIFESYEESMVSDDYVELMELFADRVKAQCVKVREEQAKVTVPRVRITAQMCSPVSEDMTGKVMAVRAERLRPEYRSAEHQLVYVTGGNGARMKAFGTACYCTALYSGERERWERYDFQGEVKPECLPQWAKERAAEIEKQETARAVSLHRAEKQTQKAEQEVR